MKYVLLTIFPCRPPSICHFKSKPHQKWRVNFKKKCDSWAFIGISIFFLFFFVALFPSPRCGWKCHKFFMFLFVKFGRKIIIIFLFVMSGILGFRLRWSLFCNVNDLSHLQSDWRTVLTSAILSLVVTLLSFFFQFCLNKFVRFPLFLMH